MEPGADGVERFKLYPTMSLANLKPTEILRIHIATQRSLVETAIHSDQPPTLVVRLNSTTPKRVIDQIVQDLQEFGTTDGPDPDIGYYGIGIVPKNRQMGKTLLEYCDRNPHIDYVSLDAVTTGEQTFFSY